MDIRKALFEIMRNDISVMAEHNDDENSLLNELMTADQDIIDIYTETFML